MRNTELSDPPNPKIQTPSLYNCTIISNLLPTLNHLLDNLTQSELQTDYSCNNQGICNTDTESCDCFIYWKGKDCGKVNVEYFDAWIGIYSALACLVVLISFFSLLQQLHRSTSKGHLQNLQIENNQNKGLLGEFQHQQTSLLQNYNYDRTTNSIYMQRERAERKKLNKKKSKDGRSSGTITPGNKNNNNNNSYSNKVHKSFWKILASISTQKVLYGFIISACLLRIYDLFDMKQKLLFKEKPNKFRFNQINFEKFSEISVKGSYLRMILQTDKSIDQLPFDPAGSGVLVGKKSIINTKTNGTSILSQIGPLNDLTVHQFILEKDPVFLNLYYSIFISSMSLIICYWSEFYFSAEFSKIVEHKKCDGVFLRKSSIAFIIFNSCLYLFVMAQIFLKIFTYFIVGRQQGGSQDGHETWKLQKPDPLQSVDYTFGLFVENFNHSTSANSNSVSFLSSDKIIARNLQVENPKINSAATDISLTSQTHPLNKFMHFINFLYKIIMAVILFVIHVVFLTIGTEIYVKHQGAFLNLRVFQQQLSNLESERMKKQGQQQQQKNFQSQKQENQNPPVVMRNRHNSMHSGKSNLARPKKLSIRNNNNISETNSRPVSDTTFDKELDKINFQMYGLKPNYNLNRNQINQSQITSLPINNQNLENPDASTINNNNNTIDSKNTPFLQQNKFVLIISNLGLYTQGCFILILSLFITGNIMKSQWLSTVDVIGYSTYVVSQKVFDFLVFLWIFCVLVHFNPENLWLLNPCILFSVTKPEDILRKNRELEAKLKREKEKIEEQKQLFLKNREKPPEAQMNSNFLSCCFGHIEEDNFHLEMEETRNNQNSQLLPPQIIAQNNNSSTSAISKSKSQPSSPVGLYNSNEHLKTENSESHQTDVINFTHNQSNHINQNHNQSHHFYSLKFQKYGGSISNIISNLWPKNTQNFVTAAHDNESEDPEKVPLPQISNNPQNKYNDNNNNQISKSISSSTSSLHPECYICRDNNFNDYFIRPCLCKGELGTVHHNCLKRFILEKSQLTDANLIFQQVHREQQRQEMRQKYLMQRQLYGSQNFRPDLSMQSVAFTAYNINNRNSKNSHRLTPTEEMIPPISNYNQTNIHGVSHYNRNFASRQGSSYTSLSNDRDKSPFYCKVCHFPYKIRQDNVDVTEAFKLVWGVNLIILKLIIITFLIIYISFSNPPAILRPNHHNPRHHLCLHHALLRLAPIQFHS